VWVKIQISTIEIDGGFPMLDVAEAASGLFHPLDRGIDGLQARVGDPVLEVGQDMGRCRWIIFATVATGGGAGYAWRARTSGRRRSWRPQGTCRSRTAGTAL
jgi:hypothetical protein